MVPLKAVESFMWTKLLKCLSQDGVLIFEGRTDVSVSFNLKCIGLIKFFYPSNLIGQKEFVLFLQQH